MPFPQVVAVAEPSPAFRAGVEVGDEICSLNGVVPRDVIEYQLLVDGGDVELELARGGITFELAIAKAVGEPLGIEVSSPVFDRVRTCDNHCEFCFIYQLPKNMRKSLYVKDDDYRLSFLYGNFTTLTRFTELDLERVVTERLSPLYVSIHATDPDVRSRMLKNRRGAISLRWLRALLDHGIEVHGQIVVCPGVNDGEILESTIAGVAERYADLASVAAVPLGVSRFSKEQAMRPHTRAEARAVLTTVGAWQERFLAILGRPMVYAADEYFLLADVDFPPIETYRDLAQHENGVGMAAAFASGFVGESGIKSLPHGGFFASVDGAPKAGYRAERLLSTPPTRRDDRHDGSVTILTGTYGARVLSPLIEGASLDHVRVLPVVNEFFGGNIGVSGLLTGQDIKGALQHVNPDDRVLLPDVCLSGGRFLDGLALEDLGRPVEVLETTGSALAHTLGIRKIHLRTRPKLRV